MNIKSFSIYRRLIHDERIFYRILKSFSSYKGLIHVSYSKCGWFIIGFRHMDRYQVTVSMTVLLKCSEQFGTNYLRAKVFLQDMWKLKINWDTPIENEVAKCWRTSYENQSWIWKWLFENIYHIRLSRRDNATHFSKLLEFRKRRTYANECLLAQNKSLEQK